MATRRSFLRGTAVAAVSVMALAGRLKGDREGVLIHQGNPPSNTLFDPNLGVEEMAHDDMVDALRFTVRDVPANKTLSYTVVADEIEPTLYPYVTRWERIKRTFGVAA